MKLQYYSEIVSSKVMWLWYPYIPYGKITLLEGDPGEGKSMLAIQIAAAVSSGRAMPDGTGKTKPHAVIYQCNEDGLDDTVKPRLERAGADCNKVAYIDENTDDDISIGSTCLEKAILRINAHLLIIDPLQSYLGKTSDSAGLTNMRSLMTQLARTASVTKCAVLIIGHVNKNESSKDLYRGLGSIDIIAAARSVLYVERAGTHPTKKMMRQIKNSLTSRGEGFEFEITDLGIEWLGPLSEEEAVLNIDDDSKNISEDSRINLAVQNLLQWLSDEDVSSAEITKLLSENGIAERTASRAKRELSIRSVRRAKGWYWHLPKEGEDQ